MTSERVIGNIFMVLVLAALAACGGGSGSTAPAATYTIGGTLTGLTGAGLVLQNNAADDLAVSADGAFTFVTPSAAYAVTVKTQPGNPVQTCTVNSGSGTASANVTGVTVTCSINAYTVGGTVSGLAGTGLVLQDNSGDDLAISANGAFTFSTSVASGANYNVSVSTQPTLLSQTCTVTSGAGTVTGANIGGVTVNCVTPSPRFAYVANNGDNTVSIYTVNAATGQWRHSGYVAAGTAPASVTVDPSGRFAYVANYGSSDISAFSINASTGALTSIGSAVPTANNPHSIVIDPSGKFAYVANIHSALISAYTIDATTGVLTSSPGGATTELYPYSVTVDPSGRFAYVTNEGNNTVSAYSIDATTGALTSIGASVAAGSQPRFVTVDPSGRFAYVANNGGSVSAYTIHATTGALTAVAGSPFAAGTNPHAVTIDPTGRFAYVANWGGSTVSAYSINATTGALASVGADVPAGTNPYSVSVDPSGKFAYAANQGSNSISAYGINATSGALTALPSVSGRSGSLAMAMTKGATAVTYTPKAAYVVNAGSATVSQFTIGTDGGIALMSTASVQTGTLPRSISVDSAGRFAFVANYTTNNVSVYSIDAGTRALTEVTGSPFAAGTSPTDVKVDSSGRFLYVSNYGWPGTGTVSAYTINATTGVLAAIIGSPFVASNGSSSIDIDPSGRFVYATNLLNDTISMFSINSASGVLTKIQDLSVTNARPISITADPTGRFAYVATACGTNWVFGINATSGLLSRADADAGGLCFGSPGAPDIAAIDPTGSHLYTGDFSMGNVVGAFGIDAIAGTVTPVTGSPFATGNGTVSVAVDQSGSYVYAAGGAGVYPFRIGSDGGLSALPGGSVAAGSSPLSITTVSSVQ